MASARINVFETIPLFHRVGGSRIATSITRLKIHEYYIPGSLSFNNVAMVVSGSGAVSENLTISFGLYSLNGATLSLANSASVGTGLTLNQTMYSWLTFGTSATQDITPGIWYFAAMSSTSLGSIWQVEALVTLAGNVEIEAAYGGPFFAGQYDTSGLPASVATSGLSKDGTDTSTFGNLHPYILISA